MQHILGVTPSETNMGDLRHTPTATRSHLKSQARPSPWPESGCPTLGSLPACSLPGCSHAAPPARDRSSLRHLPPSCPNLCGADFNKPFVGSKNDQRLGVVSVDSARVKCTGFQCPFNFRATQSERKYKQHFGYNSSVLHIIITTQNPTTHQKSTAVAARRWTVLSTPNREGTNTQIRTKLWYKTWLYWESVLSILRCCVSS
jgi:hypothetical protein